MDDLTVRRNIWTSNLPSVEKSALSRVLSRVPGYSTVAERVGTTVAATTQVAKGALEAGVAGAVVGAAQAYMGDTFGFWKNADGTYVLPAVPTAALAAGVAYAGAVLFPQEELAPTMRRAGDVALGVYVASVVKGRTMTVEQKLGTNQPPAAPAAPAAHTGECDMGYDRIARLAKQIG